MKPRQPLFAEEGANLSECSNHKRIVEAFKQSDYFGLLLFVNCIQPLDGRTDNYIYNKKGENNGENFIYF